MTRQIPELISRVQDSMTSNAVMLANTNRVSSGHARHQMRFAAGLHWYVVSRSREAAPLLTVDVGLLQHPIWTPTACGV